MKIDQKYLDLIIAGIKKREYRLNNEEKQRIRIGDKIKMVSNEEPKVYLEVLVTGIHHFDNWKNALNNTWMDDFKSLYNTLEETVNECSKFYSNENIDKYGIVVFDIEKIKDK